MSRIGLVVALTLMIPTIAAAQAPGDVVPEPPEGAPPPMIHPARTAVVVVAPPKPVELQKRWGVSARMVSMGLTDGTTESEYAGGGLAASYRINRRWEVVLGLDTLEATDGPDLHSTTIEARFHLTPFQRWDWYALVGVGALHEVPLEGEEVDESTTRGRVHAGLGLQRRFRYWSLGAEVRTVGVGPRAEEAMATPRSTSTMAADDGLSGGEVTVAATLFF